jgi:hypothetical protein
VTFNPTHGRPELKSSMLEIYSTWGQRSQTWIATILFPLPGDKVIELNKIYNEDCLETMKRMEDKMRYNRKWRKVIIWLSGHVPEKVETKLLLYLYPDDMVVTFGGPEGDV